jgi:hypothetical protein
VLVAQGLSHRVVLWRVMATPLQTHQVYLILVWQKYLLLRLNLVEHAGFLVLKNFSLVFVL